MTEIFDHPTVQEIREALKRLDVLLNCRVVGGRAAQRQQQSTVAHIADVEIRPPTIHSPSWFISGHCALHHPYTGELYEVSVALYLSPDESPRLRDTEWHLLVGELIPQELWG